MYLRGKKVANILIIQILGVGKEKKMFLYESEGYKTSKEIIYTFCRGKKAQKKVFIGFVGVRNRKRNYL